MDGSGVLEDSESPAEFDFPKYELQNSCDRDGTVGSQSALSQPPTGGAQLTSH